MSKQTTIRLPDEIDDRLKALAKRTGSTASYYIRETLVTHLEDLEDTHLAEGSLEEIRSDKDQVISSE